jgi:MFS family permease
LPELTRCCQDRLIIATAIPVITNHFNSLNDVGWYASAYLVTMSGFQLFMGRVYTFYNPKTVFISCIAVFELGSLVCGVAPNSTTLIVGRAIAGLGSSGLFSGAVSIVVYVVPLQKRPTYMGLFGAVFAVASVAGPLLGGESSNNRKHQSSSWSHRC